MANSPRVPRFSWRDWMPITATIMALIGGIVFIGGALNDVKQSKAGIADIRLRQQQSRSGTIRSYPTSP